MHVRAPPWGRNVKRLKWKWVMKGSCDEEMEERGCDFRRGLALTRRSSLKAPRGLTITPLSAASRCFRERQLEWALLEQSRSLCFNFIFLLLHLLLIFPEACCVAAGMQGERVSLCVSSRRSRPAVARHSTAAAKRKDFQYPCNEITQG